jgi:integrase
MNQRAPQTHSPADESSRTDTHLQRMRQQLLDLTRGLPVLVGHVDLVQLSNLRYEGLDPDADPDAISAASYALDEYLHRVGEQRSVGGNRARAMHYDLCRYVIPHLLEHRGQDGPLSASRWRTSDVTAFIQILAGERDLPAATVAGDRLDRLAITCHWLDLDDAASVCDTDRATIMSARLAGTLPSFITGEGQHVVRAMDLRAAGLLIEPTEPHGLAQDTAEHSLRLAQRTWARARNHGARMVGDPRDAKTKKPLPHLRQHEPKSTARSYSSIHDCLRIASRMHPVHQFVFWHARLLGLRAGEVFGLSNGDRDHDLLNVRAIGGQTRDVRAPDGTFVRAALRSGTKGSQEGEVLPGTRAEGRGLHQRTVALPGPLVQFIEAFDAVFHADLGTGLIDPAARAVPGLRDDGETAGLESFESALKKACLEVNPDAPPVTPHDLRASLNTDLENQGVDDRLLRHFLGHQAEKGRALDVHDRHYDLGVTDAGLRTIADAIGLVLPEGTDLRVPTMRMAHFGSHTARAQRAAEIEQQLLDMGWYDPTQVAPGTLACVDDIPGGEEVTTKVAARRLGLSVTHVKRLLTEGTLAGRKAGIAGRPRWLISTESLERFQASSNKQRLSDLARDWGVPYHQLWALASELGFTSERETGTAIHLTEQQAGQLRAELDRRATERSASMTLSEASMVLELPDSVVQSLVRKGILTAAESRGRGARVTRASVTDYALRHSVARVAPGERVVPVHDVREVLQVSRHVVSDLVHSRRLSVIEIGRRQFVGSDSIRAYLTDHPCNGAAGRLALFEVEQP